MTGKLTAAFFIFAASVGYGSLGVIAKFAYADGVTPAMLALSQMFFGFIFITLLKFNRLSSFVSLPRKNIFLLSVGGSMSAFTAYFYYEALGMLAASVAIVMLFQFVWIGLALELLRQKRAPTKREIAAVLLCYLGTYLSVGFDVGAAEPYGLILGFLAGAAFAVYIFFSSSFCLEESSEARVFWVVCSAFCTLFLLSIVDLEFTNIVRTAEWGAICGVLGVSAPFYIYAVFSPRIGAAATSLIGSAELPAALVLSALFLDERLESLQVMGSFIVILAVFTVFLSEAKAK